MFDIYFLFSDFIDMNGDMFPDVVTKNYIQYSPPIGGLEVGKTRVTVSMHSSFLFLFSLLHSFLFLK